MTDDLIARKRIQHKQTRVDLAEGRRVQRMLGKRMGKRNIGQE